MSVVVVGSANIDLVARCRVLPAPGETVMGSTFDTIPGGKGANQAIAAARAGARCAMVAAVGADPSGERILRTLAEAGGETAGVRTVPAPTGTALIAVADSGANSIIVIPGANARLTEPEFAVAAGTVVLAQLEVPQETVRFAFTAARARGGLTVLNAAPAAELLEGLLEVTDLLVVNEHEAAALTGGDPAGWEEALRALLERVPRVAVTLGELGVRYRDRDGTVCAVAAPRTTAVDTTAAGDTFTGALAAALDRGEPIEAALRFGCAAASLCVESAGASSSIPGLTAIEERCRDAYGSRA